MTTGGRIMGTCFGWSVGWSVGWSLGIPDDDRPNTDTDARVKFAGPAADSCESERMRAP
jgi:hypothetical protein